MKFNYFWLFKKKHPFADVLKSTHSWKSLNIHRKTSMFESLFNKVAGLNACNSIKTDSNTGLFPWILQNF